VHHACDHADPERAHTTMLGNETVIPHSIHCTQEGVGMHREHTHTRTHTYTHRHTHTHTYTHMHIHACTHAR